MNCPNCGAVNDPAGRFCQNCGQLLDTHVARLARSMPNLLAIVSARAGTALLLIWLVRTVLLRLPFMGNFNLPGQPLSTVDIITAIAYLIALAVLLNYARALGAIWPQAYPRQAPLGQALTALVYVAALVAGYLALERLVSVFADVTGLLLLQVVAIVIASVLLIRAAIVTYQHVPRWVGSLRFESAVGPAPEVACLNCGRLNSTMMKYCGYCGEALISPGGSTPPS